MSPHYDQSTSSAGIWARIKRKLVIALAIIGTGTCSFFLIYIWGAVFPSSDNGQVIYSPNRQFKAVRFNENGGGAVSSYCFDYVSVVPTSVSDRASNRDTYRVYSASCHDLGMVSSKNHAPTVESAPIINWLSDDKLEITFDVNSATHGISELKLRAYAVDGRINVIFRQFSEQAKP